MSIWVAFYLCALWETLAKPGWKKPLGTSIAVNSLYATNWAGLEGLNVPRTLWQVLFCKKYAYFLADLVSNQVFKEPDFSLGIENFIFDQPSTCNLQSVLEGSCLGCFVFSENRHNWNTFQILLSCVLTPQDIYLGLPGTVVPKRSWIKPWWWVTVHNTSQIQSLWFMTADMTKILFGSEEWWLMSLSMLIISGNLIESC